MIGGDIYFKKTDNIKNLFINNNNFNPNTDYSFICNDVKCLENNNKFIFTSDEIIVIIEYFKELLHKILLDKKIIKDLNEEKIKKGKIINSGNDGIIYQIDEKYCIKISRSINNIKLIDYKFDNNFLLSLDRYYKEGILFNIYELGNGNLNDLKLLLKNIDNDIKSDYIIKLFELFRSLDEKLLFGDIKSENIIYFLDNGNIIYKFIDYEDVIYRKDINNDTKITITPYIYNYIYGVNTNNKKINIKNIYKSKNYNKLSLFVTIMLLIMDDKYYLINIRDEDNKRLLYGENIEKIINDRYINIYKKIKNIYNFEDRDMEILMDNIKKKYKIYIKNYNNYYINIKKYDIKIKNLIFII